MKIIGNGKVYNEIDFRYKKKKWVLCHKTTTLKITI